MELPPRDTDHQRDDPPPLLGTWKRVYIAVAIYLVCVIALFDLFTRLFNR